MADPYMFFFKSHSDFFQRLYLKKKKDIRTIATSCIMCHAMRIDMYSTFCGCMYCEICIRVYLASGDRYCLGHNLDCKKEYLSMEKNVFRHVMAEKLHSSISSTKYDVLRPKPKKLDMSFGKVEPLEMLSYNTYVGHLQWPLLINPLSIYSCPLKVDFENIELKKSRHKRYLNKEMTEDIEKLRAISVEERKHMYNKQYLQNVDEEPKREINFGLIETYKSSGMDTQLIETLRSISNDESMKTRDTNNMEEMLITINIIIKIFDDKYKEQVFYKMKANERLTEMEHSKTTCFTLSVAFMAKVNDVECSRLVSTKLTAYLRDFSLHTPLFRSSLVMSQIFLYALCNISRCDDLVFDDTLAPALLIYFQLDTNDRIKLLSAYLLVFLFNRHKTPTMEDGHLKNVLLYLSGEFDKVRCEKVDKYLGFVCGKREMTEFDEGMRKYRRMMSESSMDVTGVTSFTIDQLNLWITNHEVILGSYFYSHTNGYKLRLRVYPEETHISVYCFICKGEYDDTLSWPCRLSPSVCIVNQRSGEDHNYVDNRDENITDKPTKEQNEMFCFDASIYLKDLQSVVGMIVNDSVIIKCTVSVSS